VSFIDVVERAASTSTSAVPWTIRKRLLLALIGGELIILYAPTVAWLIDRWTMSVWHNAHGFIIPPVVAYFVYRELQGVRHLPSAASAWGFPVLILALALHAVDAGMHTQLLSAVSLVLVLPGLALLFLGMQRTKTILFPLAFLVFMLPIPLALTERVHLQLREIATIGTAWLLPLLGVSVYVEHTTLNMENATLLVGDGCSGFSTLYAAVAVAALTAYSCTIRWRRMAVLAAAVPLAIAANVIRVTLLAGLTDWRGSEILSTSIHPLSGMLTFALALPVIFWLGQSPGAGKKADP
jgi:exosortase